MSPLNSSLELPEIIHQQSLPQWGGLEFQKLCHQCNVSLNCNVTFAEGRVAAFGGVTQGNLSADVDVAGLGTVIAFFLPSAVSLLISLILILCHLLERKQEKKKGFTRFIPRPGSRIPSKKHSGFAERAYNCLESILRAVSDIQILLALALAISFVVFGSYTKLKYQFDIGINLLLLACANYLQTLGLVRHYWRSWPAGLAAFIRLLAVIGIYFFLGWVLAMQNVKSSHPFVTERLPANDRNDSAILLKAACFLNPDYQKTAFEPLNKENHELIGLKENNGLSSEWIFGLLLAFFTGVVLIIRLLSTFGRFFRRHSEDKPPPANLVNSKVFQLIYWSSIWVLSFAVFCYSAVTISGLRSWVSQSGWVKSGEMGNPENEISGFGQTAALVLMAAVLIAALDNAAIGGKQSAKQKETHKIKHKKGKHAGHFV